MKFKYCVYFFAIPILIGYILQQYINSIVLSPDVTFTVEETIVYNGFQVELHTVETDDGYLLSLYHIVSPDSKPGHPVLMVPGLTQTAHTFIMNTGTTAPAFVLANEGFDVWLGNQRGNSLSRNHKTYASDSAEFWDFTVEEISQQDLPAMIRYIKQRTQKEKISYIGHSNGAVAIVLLAALQPDIADSLALAVAWCPIAGQLAGSATYFKLMTSSIFTSIQELRGQQIVGDWPSSSYNAKIVAAFPWLLEYFGRSAYDYILNDDSVERMPAYLHKSAGGTSLKSIKLCKQLMDGNNRKFTFYDYGEEENLRRYGSKQPKSVDYSQIRTKFAIMGGSVDEITTPENIQLLLDQMPKESIVFSKLDYKLDHAGFILSPSLPQMNKTVELLKK